MFKNSGLTIGLLVVLTAKCVVAAEIKPAVPARAVALRVINALYFEGDIEKAVQYFAEDATQGNIRDPGSAVEYIRKQQFPLLSLPEEVVVTLKEIVFFTEKDLDRMSKRYPDRIWGRTREPMKDGLGCLVVFEVKTPQKTVIALVVNVLKERKGEYKIVHTDDN